MDLSARDVAMRFFRNSRHANYFYALRGVSLELRGGTLTELTGRSGSGKSSLLHILAGLLRPTEGEVTLDGQDLYALPDKDRSALRNACMGIVPQNQACLAALNVLDNIKLPCRLYGAESPETETWAEELMGRLGILSLKEAYPRELSGGELRRMAIARALIRHPGILLADEPTGDLDEENTRLVLELLRQYADEGQAVLLVTHDREADRYADRILRMDPSASPDSSSADPPASSLSLVAPAVSSSDSSAVPSVPSLSPAVKALPGF